MTAVARFTPGFQPCTVPSSVTKMKMAGAFGARRKSVGLPLNITPVGDPGGFWLGALRIFTNSLGAGLIGTRCAAPLASMEYRVEVPPALLETHHGLPVGLDTRPHAFCRLGSVSAALPVLDTRFVCV